MSKEHCELGQKNSTLEEGSRFLSNLFSANCIIYIPYFILSFVDSTALTLLG